MLSGKRLLMLTAVGGYAAYKLNHNLENNNNNHLAATKQGGYKLTYFGAPGRAFYIRALLNEAKIDFEDIRVDAKQLGELRGEKGYNERVPLGQLPVLTLPSGENIAQTIPILRFFGKKTGYYPEDETKALYVEEALETTSELFGKISQARYEPDPARKVVLYEKAQKEFPKYMEFFQNRITSRKGKFIAGGDHAMICDLFFARSMFGLMTGMDAPYITKADVEKYPAVAKLYGEVNALPVFVEQQKLEDKLAPPKKP